MSETNERRPRRDGAASMPSVPEPSDESWVRYGIPREDALRILSCPECVADMRQAHLDFGRRGGPGDYAIFGVWKTVAVDYAPRCFASEETLSKSVAHMPTWTVGACLDVLRLGGLLIATPRRGRTKIYTLRPCPHQEPRRHAHEVESESAQATEQATERATSQATEQATEQAYTRRTELNRIEVSATCSRHGSGIDQPEPCRGCMEAKGRRKMQQDDQRKADELRAAQSRLSPSELHAYQPERVDAYTESCAECGRAASHAAHQPMPG